jgi:hypothetical protein
MTALGSGIRTARKAHRCDYCGDEIQPGEPYVWWKLVDGDGFFNGHGHRECSDAALWYYEPHDDNNLPDTGTFRVEVLEPYREWLPPIAPPPQHPNG